MLVLLVLLGGRVSFARVGLRPGVSVWVVLNCLEEFRS